MQNYKSIIFISPPAPSVFALVGEFFIYCLFYQLYLIILLLDRNQCDIKAAAAAEKASRLTSEQFVENLTIITITALFSASKLATI